MDRIIKRYSNDEVTVVWQPHLCIHSARCFQGLPAVFAPWKRPWVNMAGAAGAAIERQVGECPSGALSIERAGAANPAATPTATAAAPDATAVAHPPGAATDPAFRDCIRVELMADGPIVLSGEIAIRDPGGQVFHRDGRTSLCRCGGSSNKPFCDGTHKRVGFKS